MTIQEKLVEIQVEEARANAHLSMGDARGEDEWRRVMRGVRAMETDFRRDHPDHVDFLTCGWSYEGDALVGNPTHPTHTRRVEIRGNEVRAFLLTRDGWVKG